MKDWIFRTDEYICDLRTVGVLVRDGKLLVQRDRDGSEYALPGGHVRIGETTVDGLVREYNEETGVYIKLGEAPLDGGMLLGVERNQGPRYCVLLPI